MTGSVFMDTQGLFQRRRAFNMSYRNDLTCNLGECLPVYWQDLIPNSTWSCRVHGLVRFMPLIAPILSNIDLYVHFWQSPLRTLYGEDFTHVITGEIDSEDWPGIYWTPVNVDDEIQSLISYDDPEDITKYLEEDGSIFDLLGYSKELFQIGSVGRLNARKFIMYIRLIHDWYSNENVEPWDNFFDSFDWKNIIEEASLNEGNISGLIALFVYKCFKTWNTAGFFCHQWPKDYFTSALPTLQYGLPTYLPLGDSAPVTGNISGSMQLAGDAALPYGALKFGQSGLDQDNLPINVQAQQVQGTDGVSLGVIQDGFPIAINGVKGNVTINNASGLTADLSEATAITINELRIANALQVFKEREMRYGRKPQEYYKGFYGVTPGDLRLQMPKFLGGGKMPVNISDIEQTSQTTETSPQGRLAGKGTGLAGGFAKASTFAPEETLVMGIAWLMPHVLYSQALSRHDTKLNDRFDYYNPSFAHIGEQPVYNYEVYAGSYGSDEGIMEFGYQPRYTEYRFHASEIHGDLKNSLSYWTLGRIFDSQPALNANFIYMQPKVLNRIFAVRETTYGYIARNVILALQFSAAVIQPLSRYGTPGLMP